MKPKTLAILFFKLAFVAGCLYFLSTKVSWHQVGAALGQATVGLVISGILVETSAHFIDAARQWVWLRGREKPVRFSSLLKARYFSIFVGNFLPSALVGDAFRAGYLSRESGLTSESWASTVMVRVLGLVVTLLLLIVGMNFHFVRLSENGELGSGRLAWVFASVGIPLLIFFLALRPAVIQYFLGLGHRFGFPFVARLESFFMLLSTYRLEGRRIGGALLLSIYYQLSTVILVYLICQSFDVHARFVELMFHIPLISFIVMVPASYNGIGLQDVSWIYLMKDSGAPEATLFAISILWHFIRISATLPGGFVLLSSRLSRADRPAPVEIAGK